MPTFTHWMPCWQQVATDWGQPIERALAGGLAADRPAWAFAAGYQAAIQALLAPAEVKALAAVCISEAGGPHPARIEATLEPVSALPSGWRLNGEKSFVTGADGAEQLLVVAAAGVGSGGRKRLRTVWVNPASSGVFLHPLPPLVMVPELPHSRVRFEGALLPEDALLPGDGYQDFIKPFRSLEDLYVTAALLAWCFGVGRRFGGPKATLAALLDQMLAACCLAGADPSAPVTHVVLGGFLEQAQRVMTDAMRVDLASAGDVRDWWERDRRLFEIAAGARQRRFDVAWRHYGV